MRRTGGLNSLLRIICHPTDSNKSDGLQKENHWEFGGIEWFVLPVPVFPAKYQAAFSCRCEGIVSKSIPVLGGQATLTRLPAGIVVG